MSNLPESFKVYKQKVSINIDGVSVEYELYPLSGLHYGEFMEVLRSMPTDNADADNIFNTLTKPVVDKAHMLLMHMFKKSYDLNTPEDLDQLDMTISKNFINMLPVLMEINLPKGEAIPKKE